MTSSNVAPVLLELVKTLPPPGVQWPVEQRVYWLDAARNILRLIYPDPPGPKDTAPHEGE